MGSNAAFLLIANKKISNIYCAAPTHVATTNLAERIFRLAKEVSKELGWPLPLVVRGYNL